MSLYHKYRPETLGKVRGNKKIIPVLEKMLQDKTTAPHSFLFHGPTGCGKTTIGRIVAQELGCSKEDFIELDSADFRGIDTVREIRKQSQYAPLNGSIRVWMLDEIHKSTNDAQNALLKILEDPPAHVYFILCTTDPQKLLPTIKGRCSQFQVELLSEIDMLRLLKTVVRGEEETLEEEIYQQITQDSLGHPRNALQILEQVLSSEPEKRLQIAQQAALEQSQSIELCRALIGGSGWNKVASILQGVKDQDPEGIRRQVMGYAQAVLLKSDNPTAGLVLECFLEPFYNTGFPGLTFACYQVVKN